MAACCQCDDGGAERDRGAGRGRCCHGRRRGGCWRWLMRSLGARLRQHWVIAMTAVSGLLAWPWPGPGNVVNELLRRELLALLFLLNGSSVNLDSLGTAVGSLRVHAATQGFSLLFLPLAYYIAVFRWQWDTRSGILLEPFSASYMASMCTVCSHNTVILFTKEAGGDDALAAVNTVIGSVVGAFTAPVSTEFFLGTTSDCSFSMDAALWEALDTVLIYVAPMMTGWLLQAILLRWRPRLHKVVVVTARMSMKVCLTVVVYLVWCSVFASDTSGLTPEQIVAMLVWGVAVVLLSSALAWALGGRMSPGHRRAFLFAGTLKNLTVPMQALMTIFADDPDLGLYVLPLVTFHVTQTVIGAALSGFLGTRIETEVDEDDEDAAREALAHC